MFAFRLCRKASLVRLVSLLARLPIHLLTKSFSSHRKSIRKFWWQCEIPEGEEGAKTMSFLTIYQRWKEIKAENVMSLLCHERWGRLAVSANENLNEIIHHEGNLCVLVGSFHFILSVVTETFCFAFCHHNKSSRNIFPTPMEEDETFLSLFVFLSFALHSWHMNTYNDVKGERDEISVSIRYCERGESDWSVWVSG